MINKAKTKTAKKAQISPIISRNGISVTAFITKSSIPYGGVIKPIIEFTTTNTPKCTRSIPRASHVGINKGTITKIITVASKIQPTKRISKFIKSRNMIGLISAPTNNSD